MFTMKCLADIEDDNARQRANLLWRADSVAGKPTLTIQCAANEADYKGFQMVPGVEAVAHASDVLGKVGPRLVKGERLRFSLRANPTKSVKQRRTPITDDDELVAWLIRAGDGAFSLAQEEFFPGEGGPLAVSVDREGYVDVPGRNIRLSSVSFAGTLIVEDPAKMRDLLVKGIGRGKAFGFGLLQVA